jgi:hypothetical protein
MADRWRLCALHILSSKNNHALGCSSFVDASLFDLLFVFILRQKLSSDTLKKKRVVVF